MERSEPPEHTTGVSSDHEAIRAAPQAPRPALGTIRFCLPRVKPGVLGVFLRRLGIIGERKSSSHRWPRPLAALHPLCHPRRTI